MNTTKIIPAIYTYDKNSSQTNSLNILEYEDAFDQAVAYQEAGADELYILDISVNHDRKRGLLKFLKHLSKNIKLPIIVGGGIHNVRDVQEILATGVAKVTVNSAAVRNPDLIASVMKACGKDKLIIGVDSKRSFGEWKVYLNGAKSRTEIDLYNWVKLCRVKGIGEMVITLVARKSDDFDEYPIDILEDTIKNMDIPINVAIGNISEENLQKILNISTVSGIISGTYFLNRPEKILKLKQNMLNV
jgi:imidazole glycerol-phosphate synthase subunit HisF